MQQAQQPNPEAQQAAQQAQQAQLEFQQSQTAALSAQAQESQARAQKYSVEASLAPQELEIDKISAVTRNLQAGNEDDKEFERRLKVAEVVLKETELQDKKNAVESKAAGLKEKAEVVLLNSLMRDEGATPDTPRGGPRGPNVGPAPEVV